MHIRKEDIVVVLSGNFRGKQGRVLKVFPDEKKAIVEGLRMIKRHTRASAKNAQGGIVEKEAPIHISNLMLVCPKCNKPTRIKRNVVRDEAQNKNIRVRVCKKCNEMLIKTT
ncbi:50S ribosomal protein L24 [candidate division KSB1 bacterium]|nr:50S ribosomal protein L24 [candidate division KSB1 bacterium]